MLGVESTCRSYRPVFSRRPLEVGRNNMPTMPTSGGLLPQMRTLNSPHSVMKGDNSLYNIP